LTIPFRPARRASIITRKGQHLKLSHPGLTNTIIPLLAVFMVDIVNIRVAEPVKQQHFAGAGAEVFRIALSLGTVPVPM
jgi:hypothetical protein